MHKTLRKILFLLFVFLFVGLSAVLIVQTQGLVVDWQNLKFVKTGGIYIRSFPADAEIRLNGKPQKRSISIFNKGTLIKDLFPKTYDVEVRQKGRATWKKTLEVQPGLVASASAIRLFETTPEQKPLSTRIVDDFWITNAGIVEKSAGSLFLKEAKIRGIEVLEASEKSNSVVTKDKSGIVFFTNLSDPKTSINIGEIFSSLAKAKKEKIANNRTVHLHPFSPDIALVESGNAVFALDTRKVTMEKIITATTSGIFAQNANEVFLLSGKNLASYNLILGKKTIVETSIKNPTQLIPTNSTIIFIQDENGTLTAFDRANSSSTIIGTHIIAWALSKGEEKLLMANANGTFSIFYLEEDTGDVKIPKYALKKIPGMYNFPGTISIAWLEEYPGYFAVESSNSLRIIEADTRSPANTYELFSKIKKAAIQGGLTLLEEDGSLSLADFKF